MSDQKLLYSIGEAAELLSVSTRVMERLIGVNDNQIATVKIGRRRLVPAEALEDYIARLKKAS